MRVKAWEYTTDLASIPTTKLRYVRNNRISYACPDACWGEHLEAWRKERRRGNTDAPEPMPYGHCMFERPASYGHVAIDDTSPESTRKAWENCIRGDLHSWVEPGPKMEEIVKATVDAKMAGVDVGASHFLAAVSTWL